MIITKKNPTQRNAEQLRRCPKFWVHIELHNDELASMEHFWNAINSAIMVTLKTNYLFSEYRSLSLQFNPEDQLIPPKGHPYFVEIAQAYTQFSRVITEFLLKQNTIIKN